MGSKIENAVDDGAALASATMPPKKSMASEPAPDPDFGAMPPISPSLGTETHQRAGIFSRLWRAIRRPFSEGQRIDRAESQKAIAEPVTPSEAIALIHYVTENGLVQVADTASALHAAVTTYETTTRGNGPTDKALELQNEMIRHYSKLTAYTYGNFKVNGRTIKSSQYAPSTLLVTGLIGAIVFIVAITMNIIGALKPIDIETLMGWTAAQVSDFQAVYDPAAAMLYPAAWGALGAAVYLMMLLGQKMQHNQFDSRKLRGHNSRMLLGAILGTVVVNLFYDDIQDVLGSTSIIGPTGVAFLAGLGVDTIYSALIALVEKLSDVIGGLIGKSPKEVRQKPKSPSEAAREGTDAKAQK